MTGKYIHKIDSLLVVGGGKMGEAIFGGLLAAYVIDEETVIVIEPNSERRLFLETKYSIRTYASLGDISSIQLSTDSIVLLSVKPQVIPLVMPEIDSIANGALVISIAVGVTTPSLEEMLPLGSPVIKVMPNTPAMVSEGMSLVSGGKRSTSEQVDSVALLFSRIGSAMIVDESLQDAGSTISGSGPAYFALIIDALEKAGQSIGLDQLSARFLATQTMLGTARLLLDGDCDPLTCAQNVQSPGGTTEQAVKVINAYNIEDMFTQAVKAAVKRAKELGGTS